VLSDADGVTFRVQGTCMYPTMRPGDVLRIRSCSVTAVAVGDIAVCRTPDCLFSHRVIATGEQGGRPCVVTRPDRSRTGGDEPTFDDDLLGVVVAIERGGRSVPPQPADYSTLERLYYRLRLALLEAEPHARVWADAVATRVQRRAAYGRAARLWYARRRPRLRVTVRVPVSGALAGAVSRQLDPASFDPELEEQGRRLESWTLVAQVGDQRRPAASLTYVRDAAGAWRQEESMVRVRYRGSGLEEALARRGEEILARSGRA
jgi:hypothetical protein